MESNSSIALQKMSPSVALAIEHNSHESENSSPIAQSFAKESPKTSTSGTISPLSTGGSGKKSNQQQQPTIQFAATAANITFAYGRNSPKALDNISLRVPVGSIYGILGPSGCGKSTLVHCLVGSAKPSSGIVKVFGEVPGSHMSLVPGPGVGYMPQEIGLFFEFTIQETLFFFGRLYRLSSDAINDRIAFLVSFLELPDKSSVVGKLSGGQARRVSLAAALVHRPPLLVLDEPTVGIDPVLRQSIWNHLKSLTDEQGITVIITTHYIEEARLANLVAFMRNGTLLEEGNPETLIRRLGMANLEDVFLALCNNKTDPAMHLRKAKEASPEGSAASESEALLTIQKPDSTKTQCSTYSPVFSNIVQNRKIHDAQQLANSLHQKRNKCLDHLARTSALITKNFIRMWRSLTVLLFTILIPALQCILFFLCLGRHPYDIPVAVYNQEMPLKESVSFLSRIDNHTIALKHVYSLQAGIDSVRDGEAKAFLSIPQNFTNALGQRGLMKEDVDDDVLDSSRIGLQLDMTYQFHSNSIRQKIFEAYELFAKDLLKEHDMNPKLADPPIHIKDPILGSSDPAVTDFMVPGFVCTLQFFSSIATAALTLVLERRDGIFERSLVAGVAPNEYILSHVITQTVVVVFQTILVLLISFSVFDMPKQRPDILGVSADRHAGRLWHAYGVLISAIAKDVSFTLTVCMASMFPQFLLSGVVWPADTMPSPLRIVSTFFSQATSLEACRSMLFRGWNPLQHFDVSLGFIISAGWTLVFLFIATILFNVHK